MGASPLVPSLGPAIPLDRPIVHPGSRESETHVSSNPGARGARLRAPGPGGQRRCALGHPAHHESRPPAPRGSQAEVTVRAGTWGAFAGCLAAGRPTAPPSALPAGPASRTGACSGDRDLVHDAPIPGRLSSAFLAPCVGSFLAGRHRSCVLGREQDLCPHRPEPRATGKGSE